MKRMGLLYRLLFLKEKINRVHVCACDLLLPAYMWEQGRRVAFSYSQKFMESSYLIFHSINFFFEKLESVGAKYIYIIYVH